MSTPPNEDVFENLSREEVMSALFANLVFQNTNMALMMLGRLPHPQTGKKEMDVQAARMFIDQLEMLSEKTKGNLNKDEEQLLNQSLTHVRLAFFETVEKASGASQQAKAPEGAPKPDASDSPSQPPADAGPAAASAEAQAEEESRKRFSKKY